MDKAAELDIVGVLEGTDKSSSVGECHDFLYQYQPFLEPFRHEPINLIEIGVDKGGSLRTWKYYFPRANLVGVDIRPACARLEEDRITIKIGSQEDPEFLAQLCANYPPTIIIDDGSHKAHHIIHSFERMYPSLLPGGLYIIEDVRVHVGPDAARWQAKADQTVADYFLDIAKSRMACRRNDEHWGIPQYIREKTDYILFPAGAILLKKRNDPRDSQGIFRFAQEYLRDREGGAQGVVRLLSYVIRHRGPFEEAEELVQAALTKYGEDPGLVCSYADFRLRQQHVDEKVFQLLHRVAERNPTNSAVWHRLGLLARAMNDLATTEYAFRQAVGVDPTNSGFHDELSKALESQGKYAEALKAAQRAYQLAEGKPNATALGNRVKHLQRRLEK
jgi:hypothetical protein